MEAFQRLRTEQLDRLVRGAKLVDVPTGTLVSKQGKGSASYGAPDGGPASSPPSCDSAEVVGVGVGVGFGDFTFFSFGGFGSFGGSGGFSAS